MNLCTNTLPVSCNRIEQTITSELKERILTTENLEYVYKKVEKLTAEGLNKMPEIVEKKKVQYEKVLSEIQNYLNFIKLGNLSKAVSAALTNAETKSEASKEEIASLLYGAYKNPNPRPSG